MARGDRKTLFVRDGHLVYHYNWFDIERYEVTSTEKVPAGEVELSLEERHEQALRME
jgi:hypothetical protein